jgi:hypothetical protein
MSSKHPELALMKHESCVPKREEKSAVSHDKQPEPRRVREWAQEQGYEIGTRGRLSPHLIADYIQAQGKS